MKGTGAYLPPEARDPSLKHSTIHIGGVYVSRVPAVVRTVLGSCVSACLYDPALGIGGMNHFILPDNHEDDGDSTRYGINAMEVLINRLMKLGADRFRLQAKVFGGGDILGFNESINKVGPRNAEFILRFLRDERIEVIGQRLGGSDPLDIFFFTHTAKVLVRPLRNQNINRLVQSEQRYRASLAAKVEEPAESRITLF